MKHGVGLQDRKKDKIRSWILKLTILYFKEGK